MSLRGILSTAQLVELARDPAVPLREQHSAFSKLVELSNHFVFGLALAAVRNPDDAEDAAQDAFMAAWMRLGQLRDPGAFPGWLKRIVTTQCNRRLRRRTCESTHSEWPGSLEADPDRTEYKSLVGSAIAALPQGERDVSVLFYFFGYTQEEIARLLHLKAGTVGKRLHSVRLKIRRRLPPAVRGYFVRLMPSRTFIEKVRLGLFDEYVGEYRFERRPDHVVSIRREGDSLVSFANNQRNILASLADRSLMTNQYDGEARFQRDRRGRVSGFVYYEFGKRLGIARKSDAAL